jgi:hypothetical protein
MGNNRSPFVIGVGYGKLLSEGGGSEVAIISGAHSLSARKGETEDVMGALH